MLGALGAYTQAGRAIYDLYKRVYRVRELSREPLPMDKLRFANEREERATRLLEQQGVRADPPRAIDNGRVLAGTVKDGSRTHQPTLRIDRDERMVEATCTCNFYQQNKLFKGPCEHMLALRRGGR